MANSGLRESVVELQLARARATADPGTRRRAQAAADTLRLAEHWRRARWYTDGSGYNVGPAGRGWHDAENPSKLP